MRGGAELSSHPRPPLSVILRVDVTVTHGPFAEAGEQLGGFYIVEAPDIDEAIALAGELPEGIVEVRPTRNQPNPRCT